jgi:hypothetical protein
MQECKQRNQFANYIQATKNSFKDIFSVYQFTNVFVSNNSKLLNFDWNG